jgi:Ribbon-helix-helix protein, copG family
MAPPKKGPKKPIQFEDDEQLAAVDRAAAEDGVNRSELVRQFIAYGLAMRHRAREETSVTDPGTDGSLGP